MKKILLLGAGLSASTLIKYLLNEAEKNNWILRIGDKNINLVNKKINGHKHGEAITFDVDNKQQIDAEVQNADIVISMLPARFHLKVAKACLKHAKNLATASYVSPKLKLMDDEVKKKGLIFLNEIGLDPGIDHMSAMKIIDKIKQNGGVLKAFKSYTGALVAPEYDNNPWNYKFSWNPRNVVVAGQGSAAQYIENGNLKIVPYHRLFKSVSRTNVKKYGEFEVYPNRNSLKYREIYNLQNIPTLLRGTLRRPGFSRAWDSLVQLGMTEDTFTISNSNKMTYREFTEAFMPNISGLSIEEKTAKFLNLNPQGDRLYKLRWLGLFDDTQIKIKNATPAQVLQEILSNKWTLKPNEKDMIVMQHIFDYQINGQSKSIESSMGIKGKNIADTAIAMTVGLPLAIAVKMILTNQIKTTGVIIPTMPEIYNPILSELEKHGITFWEEEKNN